MPESGNVGEIRVGLSLDSINFSQGMKDVNNRISALNAEFRAISTGSDKFDSSLESLRAKADVLSRSLETHKSKVEELKRQYEESAQANGENANETIRLARAYNNAVTAMNRVETQLTGINGEIEQQTNVWKQLEKRVGETAETLNTAGEKMQGIGQSMSASITAPLAGFGVLAGKAAMDFDSAAGIIQAEIGTTGAEAEKLQKTAQNLWKQGFGDSMESVAVQVAGVSKALGDLSEVDLSNVTQGLDLFEKRGWADQQESLRAVKVLMEQFGMSASEAMNYLTRGFQENLNYSGEFLDTISEYSTYFAELGFDANDMFAKLKSGAESGAFQLDKVGDAMKEFSLRAKDGSKTSTAAFEALGLNAKDMTDQFNKGGDTAKEAFGTVVKALQGVGDETTRNSIATSLFGTQYEDLGEAAFTAMLQASEGLKDVEGATKRASEAMNDNFGARAQKAWREFLSDIEPAGDALLDIADNVLPKVSDMLGRVTGAFADMSPTAQTAALTIAGIAAAAGPVAIGVGTITTGVSSLMTAVAPLIPALGAGTGLAASLTAIAGPAAIVVAGLGLLGMAAVSIKNDMEAAKQVNLESAEAMITQQQEIEGLTSQYQALSEKNKLTNDELLRFRDIQSEMDLGGTAEQIAALKEEQAGLQEKSGLMNEEMNKLLGLNDQLIEKVPDVTTALSDHGNAIIADSDALTVANERLRENIALELENQRIKAEAQLNENISAYVTALEELNAKERERNTLIKERDVIEQNISALKIQAQEQINAGKDEEASKTAKEIVDQEFLLNQYNSKIQSVADEVSEKQKSVAQTEADIQKTQDLYNKMINLQLAQVGINTEGDKGIKQLDDAIAKTQSRITELNNAKTAQGGLNGEQQKELENLESALGKYQSTKGEIQKIQKEQASVNSKIKEGTGEAEKMTKELDKDVKKEVDVDDKGEADKLQQKLEKEAKKKVIITALWEGIKQGLNLPGFADGTRNAPGGLSIVGEEGPELVHLPRGASVIPNADTESILRKWNIPMLASGGIALTAGMAYVGERGRELIDYGGAMTAPLTASGGTTYTGPIYVTIEGKTVQEFTSAVDFFNSLKQTSRKMRR